MMFKTHDAMKTKMLIIICALGLLVASCKSESNIPSRKAPRHCNSCTKWSYIPEQQDNASVSGFACLYYAPSEQVK